VRLDHIVGNGPRTAVNDQNRICRHSKTPRNFAEISLAGCGKTQNDLIGR
jgi:hypothetical protein